MLSVVTLYYRYYLISECACVYKCSWDLYLYASILNQEDSAENRNLVLEHNEVPYTGD